MDKPKSFIKKNFRNHSCPGLALSRCSRCSCIGPCAMVFLGRLFIFARYTLCMRLQWKRHINLIVNKERSRVRTSKFPLERKQRCSMLVLVLYCISALYHHRNTFDWTRWRHKITAQRIPAPRSCVEPHAQVLHWALLGPALFVPPFLSGFSEDLD